MRFVGVMVERVILIGSVLFFLQAPQFMTLYTERLGGHVAEARYQVTEIEKMASHSGKSLQQFIESVNGELQGFFVRSVERKSSLEKGYQGLLQSSSFQRPFVLALSFQPEIAVEVLKRFQPGLPMTLEGAIWGIVGMLVAMGFFASCRKIYQGF